MSSIIIQKYGGSSVATSEKIRHVAKLIDERSRSGEKLCVVVSAMGKTTDQLLSLALEISKNPSRRELDMLLSCGERASMALLAIALEELGCKAVSLTGSQSGIITSDVHSGAKILEMRPDRVKRELDKGKVVIVAGFQGISVNKEITTLGRGGSDTTAVALAAALDATACEIYSDVEGVFSADPNLVSGAILLPQITLDEMEELSLFGAKVMHAQALQFARTQSITIHALKTGSDDSGGTLISPKQVEQKISRVSLTIKEPVYHFSATGEESLEAFFRKVSQQKIGHLQVNGASDADGGKWNFFLHPEDAYGLEQLADGLQNVQRNPDCATITLVGLGLCETPRISVRALSLLREHGFQVKAISTSPNRSTFVLQMGEGAKALRILHKELVEALDSSVG